MAMQAENAVIDGNDTTQDGPTWFDRVWPFVVTISGLVAVALIAVRQYQFKSGPIAEAMATCNEYLSSDPDNLRYPSAACAMVADHDSFLDLGVPVFFRTLAIMAMLAVATVVLSALLAVALREMNCGPWIVFQYAAEGLVVLVAAVLVLNQLYSLPIVSSLL